MSGVRLSLLVLRASDAARTRRFYESLGLAFAVEQHETGALHYSCALGDTLIEIYPGHESRAPEANSGGATMLGLTVDDLDGAFTAATAGGARVRRPPSEHSRRAVVEDPDGRVVEITPR